MLITILKILSILSLAVCSFIIILVTLDVLSDQNPFDSLIFLYRKFVKKKVVKVKLSVSEIHELEDLTIILANLSDYKWTLMPPKPLYNDNKFLVKRWQDLRLKSYLAYRNHVKK